MNMTTYTADDFKKAHQAERGRYDLAVRIRRTIRHVGGHDVHGVIEHWAVIEGDEIAAWGTDEQMAEGGWVPVQETPRPLTPDAITDEMVERARAAAWGDQTGDYWVRKAREVLVAGLTEPPSRPDGAADIEVELTGLGPLELDNPLSAREQTAIADFLAERGVRVTGGN